MKPQYIKIDEDGKFYYSDKAMTICHREDGPAVETLRGSKAWCVDGKFHREDGPAIEFSTGVKAWYVNDIALTEEQFNARFVTLELTMDQIAAKFGVSVEQLKITK